MGFLSSYDGEIMEPLLWPKESPVSIQFARGGHDIALESRQGNQASRRIEGRILRSFSNCGRKPWVPLTSDGDLRELLMVPMVSQEYCGVGGGAGSRQSTGVGSMEEGLISS